MKFRLPYPRRLAKRVYFRLKYGCDVASPTVAYNVQMGRGIVVRDFSVIANCAIGDMCYFNRGAEAHFSDIGKFCSFGPYCQIGLNEHLMHLVTTSEALYTKNIVSMVRRRNAERTTICHDAWVGSRVVVLKGLTMSVGSVAAAGAVVTKDVPPYAIVAGIPAKVIKQRFSDAEISELLQSEWWQLPAEQIITIMGETPLTNEKSDVFAFCDHVRSYSRTIH